MFEGAVEGEEGVFGGVVVVDCLGVREGGGEWMWGGEWRTVEVATAMEVEAPACVLR